MATNSLTGRRTFLGWDKPGLVLVRDWLLQEASEFAEFPWIQGQSSGVSSVDLSDWTVALPGARAGRRLLELLAREAGVGWRPPKIVTPGVLTDMLVQVDDTSASRLARTTAWARALKKFGAAGLQELVVRPPESDDWIGWLRLAERLRSLHAEFAVEGKDFGEVLKPTKDLRDARGSMSTLPPGETRRWEILVRIQKEFRAQLEKHELEDPHEARHAAIKKDQVLSCGKLALVGVVDLNSLLRSALDKLAERGEECHVLVLAPGASGESEGRESDFDEWGALKLDAWENAPLQFDDSESDPEAADFQPGLQQWAVVDKPAQAARVAAERVGYWGLPTEEVTLGIADERLKPFLQRQFSSLGVRSIDAAGTPHSLSAPYKLLDGLARYLNRKTWSEWSELLRHPDLEQALLQVSTDDSKDLAETSQSTSGSEVSLTGMTLVDWVDKYQIDHLPPQGQAPWPGKDRRAQRMRLLSERFSELLGDLFKAKTQALAKWGDSLREFLGAVYGEREFQLNREGDHRSVAAIKALCDGLDEICELHADLAPRCTAAVATELLLGTLEGQLAAPFQAALHSESESEGRTEPQARIEMQGWLELALDDAPGLVVAGFNDGCVPESAHLDPFLPDSLRANLGLTDNRRRLARDLYAASLILASRKYATLITARRNSDGDPLLPSRLLFQCAPEETHARVQRFLQPEAALPAQVEKEPQAQELARTAVLPVMESMSVSSFKTYLSSPYAFYLKHVLNLESVDDRARELDGRSFGNLVHEVLERFGRSKLRHSKNAEAIFAWLDEESSKLFVDHFGREALPAVLLQREQMARRLKGFAQWQAQWASDGWRIEFVEWPPRDSETNRTPPFAIEVDGQVMQVRGRIDRIDFHPTRGWALLDYKSGDKPKPPEKAHRAKIAGELQWIDLQLPLYRHLVGELSLEGDIRLGYVNLHKDPDQVGADFAEWSAADLEHADETMDEVIRKVRNQEFFELKGPGGSTGKGPFMESAAMSALFGEGLLGSTESDEDSEGGEAQ